MIDHENLVLRCEKALVEKGIDTPVFRKRLRIELKEIEAQGGAEYVWNLFDSGNKYPNVNNLLCYYLMGICPDVLIDQDPEWIDGEYPDIDTDMVDVVRDWVKNDWAASEFGEEYVSNIGAYGTFGLRSAFIDMAKVHGYDRGEIQSITTNLEAKDDEGKALKYDKALELYDDLRAYCEHHPEVADSVKRIVNRNHNIAKHAGGLIITDKKYPIRDLVPVFRGKDGTPQTMWVEGLSGQDLQPVGLIKYDFLSLTNLKQLACIKTLIKKRHGLKNICSLPGIDTDWSDTSYLNDPDAIAMANRGDMKCIFQFDSAGIRKMVKGNVTSFADLVAFSALWRPGPLGMKMQERYVERKAGREPFTIYPILQPILGVTYGVMVFQEQVMKILNVVGKIPLKDCEKVRKAISKKKVEQFIGYKEMFVTNGQKVLGASEEELLEFWAQIESFAEYGFNRSHSVAYTFISSRLLWLKTHYPLEFYCGTLMCESETQKMKEYKLDALRYGRNIKVSPVDINLSKANFSIQKGSDGQEQIYYGMWGLKGIGEAVAKKIEDGQPYAGLRDFLERFGTDSKVCTALILLNAFPGDRTRNFKYYEFYKTNLKKMVDRDKRHMQSEGKHILKLEECLKEHGVTWAGRDVNFSDEFYESICGGGLSEEAFIDIQDLRETYQTFKDKYAKKVEEDYIPSIDDFNPDNVVIDEKWQELLMGSMGVSEQAIYGFVWVHDLEKSPDYQGEHTFEDFRNTCEKENLKAWKAEVKVIQANTKTTKSGKPFYSLQVEDAVGEAASITVWAEDFDRFAEEFRPGSLLGVRLNPPHPPFPSYTLESPPRHLRWRLPPKDSDLRVTVLRRGECIPGH